jgi:general secretion pathway protein G
MKTNNPPHIIKNRKRNRAFTLVEMLLVVAIIGILAALVIPKMVGTSNTARITAAMADIKGGIKTALDRYEVENGMYPRSLQDLVTKPNDAKNWTGPYLDEIPKEPWQQPYVYVYPGRNNPNGYDLYSIGPDGQDGSQDDIGNWTK